MEQYRFAAYASARRIRDAHRQAGELLFQLGVTPHTTGFDILRDGARLIADSDRNRHLKMTEELYPAIGAIYCQSGSGIEHAVRDAVRTAWQREDAERPVICTGSGTPGNAALLYALAEQIRICKARTDC